MKKSLEKLALIYFGEKDGQRFFEYIIESQINGNFKQVVNLFNEMQYADKARFLIELTKMEIAVNFRLATQTVASVSSTL